MVIHFPDGTSIRITRYERQKLLGDTVIEEDISITDFIGKIIDMDEVAQTEIVYRFEEH